MPRGIETFPPDGQAELPLPSASVHSPNEHSKEPSIRALSLATYIAIYKDRIETPTDPLTHLPLPIAPNNWSKATRTSEHHAAHPNDSELLTEDQGGLAVRQSRLQLVAGLGGEATYKSINNPRAKPGDHQLYHYYYKGPRLPYTQAGKFEYVVWATMLDVPDRAIAFPNKEPKIVTLNRKQVEQVRSNIRLGGINLVADFLGSYLKDQDLSHIDPTLIDEFVNSRDRNRRIEIGNYLLEQASEIAVDPLRGTYESAKKLGRIAMVDLPGAVTGRLGGQKKREKIIKELRAKLAAA